jgi:hypothetical protein
MNTKGVFRTAALKFAQEYDTAIHFAHRYIPILNARKELLHFVQLMIVRGKERACVRFRILVNVLHNGPSD